MADINTTIQDAIKKHLPEQVAGELKDYFEQFEKMKIQKEKIEGTLAAVRRDFEHCKKELDAHDKMDDRANNAVAHEKANAARTLELDNLNRELANVMLRHELKVSDAYSKNVSQFMINMSRNTSFRKTFSGEIPVGSSGTVYKEDQYGSQQLQSQNIPETRYVDQETTIIEE